MDAARSSIDSIQDEILEEQENSEDYAKGGYHAAKLGDVIGNRYFIVRKLGWGQFSTVWLSWDLQVPQFVAIKIIKSAENYAEAALDELALLTRIAEYPEDNRRKRVIQLLDHFDHHGVNGTHMCMVFPVLGRTLLKLIGEYDHRGIPINQVRNIVRQILEGLNYLHDVCGIIHCDLKPENVLLAISFDHIERLAAEAIEIHENGYDLPVNFTSSCNIGNSSPVTGRNFTGGGRRKNSLNVTEDEILSPLFTGKGSSIRKTASPVTGKRKNSLNVTDDKILFTGNGRKYSAGSSTGEIDLPVELRGAEERGQRLLCASPDPLGHSSVVIADLGNACWIDNHFSDEIQTRQYRAPEVIINSGYGPNADVWSLGCIAYELATGNYLFNAHGSTNYSTTENHLALITSILEPIPRHLVSKATYKDAFNKYCDLRRELVLPNCDIEELLHEEGGVGMGQAKSFAEFLKFVLQVDPNRRPSAGQCLSHPWIQH